MPFDDFGLVHLLTFMLSEIIGICDGIPILNFGIVLKHY